MLRALLAAAIVLGAGGLARAEIAVLKNGSTFKITSWRVEGEMVFFTLKDGGELGTALTAVRGFVPDEVVEEIVEQAPLRPEAGGEANDLRSLAIEAARRPVARVAQLSRLRTALGRSAYVALSRLKRRWLSDGHSEADVHRLIPDRPRKKKKEPEPVG